MKTLIAASLIALSSVAVAQPFAYQEQIGSTEYVHDYDTRHINFAPVEKSNLNPSLSRLMVEANVDGIALNDFNGTIIESGPSRISLYEIQRGSPESTAYNDYYAKYPADTDWERVAREFRAKQQSNEIAAERHNSDLDS